jgi:trans-aconitate methyltransferase
MTRIAQKLLALKGIHWLATRFGGSKLSGMSFDEKFRRKDWDFTGESPDLVELVEKHSSKGHLLLMGCGTAPIVSALNPDSYDSLLGVDLSTEAVSIASQRANERIRFEVGDMNRHRFSRDYNVILFSESLYYVHWFKRKKLLGRMQQHLAPGGRIIVTIADPKRYSDILSMVRRNFTVDVDRPIRSSERHVLVFS